jgi:hypothetical protein
MVAIMLLSILMVMPVMSGDKEMDAITGTGTDGKTRACTYSYVIDTSPYSVYNDTGIPSDAEVWTWDGGSGAFDGNYTGDTSPEGTKCFKTDSANWAGWGVFLIYPSDHTVNLSAYNSLKFCVKTPANLKVEIQQDNRSNGQKYTRYISQHGWNGTNTWQEITIPASAFTGADMNKIFSPFMVTIETSGTFYIDNVRWVPAIAPLKETYWGHGSSNSSDPYNTYCHDSRAQVV